MFSEFVNDRFSVKVMVGNASILKIGGDEILFSYGVPVAGFVVGFGYWRRGLKFSRTSSQHANKYLPSGFNDFGRDAWTGSIRDGVRVVGLFRHSVSEDHLPLLLGVVPSDVVDGLRVALMG